MDVITEDKGYKLPSSTARREYLRLSDSAVEVDSLVKRYGALLAVDSVSFTVPRGEIFAFLGPNGAGKTTTIEILECLRKPTSGRAWVLGYDVMKNAKKIKRKIGVLPQDFNTFERLTVRENLHYFRQMYGGGLDIDRLVELVGLSDKAKELYKNLSGGLKQRLGVAIALVNDPELVFLDEPTRGLDPKARRETWGIIKTLREEGKTVFLTTQYMEEAQYLADTVMIINRGRIVASGSPNELISKSGIDSVLVVRGGGKAALDLLEMGKIVATLDQRSGDVTVTLKDKSSLVDAIMALGKGGLRFEELEIKRPSLEDVFLQLTGEKLLVEEGR